VIAARQLAGMQIMDSLIAGMVGANEFALATHDVAGFANCAIETIDPWYR
jgi:predicted nucleic acid-binding protein